MEVVRAGLLAGQKVTVPTLEEAELADAASTSEAYLVVGLRSTLEVLGACWAVLH